MTAQFQAALSLGPDEGERLNWLGEPTTLKVTGAETGGHYAIAEVISTPDGFVPLHVHNSEDEAFFIVDGEVDFTVGDRTFSVGPGAFVFGPRGVPHSYKVKTPSARIMMMFSPAGFEGFIRETSVPLDSPAPEDEMDMDALMATASRYGATILG
jgi:mannose-6-phosphate isomerase-like protein (cupin superfamily)